MARIGKTQIIGEARTLSSHAGFYCSVCECIMKDSVTYLDHINGKWHRRGLGMSMRVEKVDAIRVRNRIAQHKMTQECCKTLQAQDSKEAYEYFSKINKSKFQRLKNL